MSDCSECIHLMPSYTWIPDYCEFNLKKGTETCPKFEQYVKKPLTNYEKILRMSIDEMAKFLEHPMCMRCIYRSTNNGCIAIVKPATCISGHKLWLQQAAK